MAYGAHPRAWPNVRRLPALPLCHDPRRNEARTSCGRAGEHEVRACARYSMARLSRAGGATSSAPVVKRSTRLGGSILCAFDFTQIEGRTPTDKLCAASYPHTNYGVAIVTHCYCCDFCAPMVPIQGNIIQQLQTLRPGHPRKWRIVARCQHVVDGRAAEVGRLWNLGRGSRFLPVSTWSVEVNPREIPTNFKTTNHALAFARSIIKTEWWRNHSQHAASLFPLIYFLVL